MNQEGIKVMKEVKACRGGYAWARKFDTPSDAWEAIQRPAWLRIALAGAGYSDDKVWRIFACWCARETPLIDGRKVWDLLTDKRSRHSVEVAEAFIRGEIALPEVESTISAVRADPSDPASMVALGVLMAAASDRAGLATAAAAAMVAAGTSR